MDLPGQIGQIFSDLTTGVLIPVLKGIYGIAPYLIILAIVAGVAALLFAPRASQKTGGLLLCLVVAFVFWRVPDLLTALMSYTGTGMADSPADVAKEAASEGMNAALGTLEQ